VNPSDSFHLSDVVQHVLQVDVLQEQSVVEREEPVADASNVVAHGVRL